MHNKYVEQRTVSTRRGFLTAIGMGATGLSAGCTHAEHTDSTSAGPADLTLRIGTVLVDIAKNHTISTVGYNGAAPGPPIRLREGVSVTVELINDTDTPEFVHWHGMTIPAPVDGAEEEKSHCRDSRNSHRGRH